MKLKLTKSTLKNKSQNYYIFLTLYLENGLRSLNHQINMHRQRQFQV